MCSVSLLTAVVGLQLLQSQQDKKAKGGVVVTSDTDEVDILPNSQLVAVCAILVGKQPGSHIHFFTSNFLMTLNDLKPMLKQKSSKY